MPCGKCLCGSHYEIRMHHVLIALVIVVAYRICNLVSISDGFLLSTCKTITSFLSRKLHIDTSLSSELLPKKETTSWVICKQQKKATPVWGKVRGSFDGTNPSDQGILIC